MPETIDVIYENGVLRPLVPLALREHQTVQIRILPINADETALAIQTLISTGLLTPPSGLSTLEALPDPELRKQADLLAQAATRSLSEIIIEERGEW